MKIDELQTDQAIMDAIGTRLAQIRVKKNFSQELLASKAGVGKSTVERLEAGRPVKLTAFIRILRSLEMIDGLNQFLPESGPSPMDLLKLNKKHRQRAYTSTPKAKIQEAP